MAKVDVFEDYSRLTIENQRLLKLLDDINRLTSARMPWVAKFKNSDLLELFEHIRKIAILGIQT